MYIKNKTILTHVLRGEEYQAVRIGSLRECT